MEYTYDVGNNLAAFGWAYLLFRFVLPFVGGLIFLAFSFWALYAIAGRLRIQLDRQTIAYVAAGLLILMALLGVLR